MKRFNPVTWLMAVLGLAFALLYALPDRKVDGFDLNAFGGLPVLEGGRVKPLDTVGRTSLLMLRSQQAFRHEGKAISARQWMADMLFHPAKADTYPTFVINDPEVLGVLGKPQQATRYYAFNEIKDRLEEIERQGQAAQMVEPALRTRFQRAMGELYTHALLYHRIQHTLAIAGSPGLAWELSAEPGPDRNLREEGLVQLAHFRPLLPLPGEKAEAWLSVGEGLRLQRQVNRPHPGLGILARMQGAWLTRDAMGFNAALSDLRSLAATQRPHAMDHSDRELAFNRAEPFFVGMVLYVLAFLAVAVSWAWKRPFFPQAGFGLLIAGALVHTGGLVTRILLQGRPPVTNLYSSAIFVGWGIVVVGLVLERMYRRGFGTAVSALAGFATLIIAQHLTDSGDTMEMMRAVLDSNFWLATHVVTITIGYSGTFLAGAIALFYAVHRHVVRQPDPSDVDMLKKMTYGVICFSLFFSFVGTVLGGIWADQSWGRFWGWDPKENGALLLVLWNAIILHARWGGFVKEKGFMAMAIFGNVITSLSWFGVNLLGVGLHAYGFMDKGAIALLIFGISQVLFIVLCLLPRRFWEGRSA